MGPYLQTDTVKMSGVFCTVVVENKFNASSKTAEMIMQCLILMCCFICQLHMSIASLNEIMGAWD